MNFFDRIKRVICNIYYKRVFGEYSFNSTIMSPLRLTGMNAIYIKNNVCIHKQCWISADKLSEDIDPQIIIGEGTTIGDFNHIYAIGKIEIGKNVLTANHVYISDTQHLFENVTISIKKQGIKHLKNITISDGAWLGENVCIIGANIGKNVVVGANSVVTHDIPDYCVAVGSPAYIIKRYDFERKEWRKTDKEGCFIE